ncbi:MAG: hypothetical protein HQL73_05245 [Magnetococcales bacterium]|nr:hypothetical protein [Magnetococcales bacterium]
MKVSDDIKPPIDAELMRAIAAAKDALSDQMVERMASTACNLMEVSDQLNNQDTMEAIVYLLERLTHLHRIGAIDTLVGLLEIAHCGRMAMTDSMISRLLGFVEHMVNNLANEEMATMLSTAFEAVQDVVEETRKNPPQSTGLFATLAMLGKPKTLQTIRFMLAVAEKMEKRFEE